MKAFITRTWTEDDGVLSFEWVLLLTLLTIGIVAGVTGARDAMVDELGDVANAALCVDQSYFIPAINLMDPDVVAPAQGYHDSNAGELFKVKRSNAPAGQDPQDDMDS